MNRRCSSGGMNGPPRCRTDPFPIWTRFGGAPDLWFRAPGAPSGAPAGEGRVGSWAAQGESCVRIRLSSQTGRGGDMQGGGGGRVRMVLQEISEGQ
ncbi:hypothetical protein CMUS01_05660 [Colletotrichum musicola]|uniref:Uncharacterized protein n=1 Tax=Colletotrichum musicola TaxID=2175873 RepID=A0A8H6NKC3_9PEZI|nr:hypothetical protein CMUS01_05660 [Colletotrichum musicola]